MKAINYPSLQHAYCMLSICKGRFSSVTTCRNNPQAGPVPKKPMKEQLRFGSTEVGKFGVRMVFPWDLPSLKLGAVLVFVTVVNLCGAVSTGHLESHGENHVSDSPFQDTLPKTNGFLQKMVVSNRNLWKSKGDFQGVMLVSGSTMTLIGCRPAVVWERNM